MATGDYENDDEMMAYYEPAMANIYRKEQNKTGDGQKMMVWAGACMEDACGSKVQHDFDAGPGSMADMPFLAVKNDGSRFCNEATCEMAVMGNFLRSEADQGWYSQIFDSNYMADTEGWPGVALPPEAMASYMPEVEGEKTGRLREPHQHLLCRYPGRARPEARPDRRRRLREDCRALQRAGREGHR